MEYYFKNDAHASHRIGDLFLPIVNKQGLSAFKLIIYKLDNDKFKITDCSLLVQYMLLHKSYGLNTIRVVNLGSQTANTIYVYDLSCTIIMLNQKSA